VPVKLKAQGAELFDPEDPAVDDTGEVPVAVYQSRYGVNVGVVPEFFVIVAWKVHF
jgi:hypothetical protein